MDFEKEKEIELNIVKNCDAFLERRAQPYDRFRSYDYCKNLFDKYYKKEKLSDCEIDYFALNLFCYLASWGMLRGSGWLLKNSYEVFFNLAKELFETKYDDLIDCDPFSANFVYEKYRKDTLALRDLIEGNLEKVANKKISRILACKIIMGTYGCVPAYDRFDIMGFEKLGLHIQNLAMLNEDLLRKTFEVIEKHKNDLREAQKHMMKYNEIHPKDQVNYSIFKLLDMALWIYGEKVEKESKAQKNKEQREQKQREKEEQGKQGDISTSSI